MLNLSSKNIVYLLILIFSIIVGTLMLIIWILQKKRLENNSIYYIKNNKDLDLWNYIKRNIILYSVFFCYVISFSAFFILIL